MNASSDFSLCIRKASSCSKHADCARAQLGSSNPQRQSFIAPTLTGDACSAFYSFEPFRALAENGGGIGDATSGAGASQGRSDTNTNSDQRHAAPRPAIAQVGP